MSSDVLQFIIIDQRFENHASTTILGQYSCSSNFAGPHRSSQVAVSCILFSPANPI